MAKHFVLDRTIKPVQKEAIIKGREEIELMAIKEDITRWNKNNELISDNDNLLHTHGRVIVKINLDYKNTTKFNDGTIIRLERKYNNFNRRETEAVNAVVISAEDIPSGSEILIGHNALHDTNKIFNYKRDKLDIGYYSLPEYECFGWLDENCVPHPMKNFEFGLRIWKPYKGMLAGIEPELLKDVLFVKTGKLSGNVVNVLKASDYTIIYQGRDGVEKREIRFRHSEDENFDREEIICINHDLTEKVLNSELLIGIELKDAKTINEINL